MRKRTKKEMQQKLKIAMENMELMQEDLAVHRTLVVVMINSIREKIGPRHTVVWSKACIDAVRDARQSGDLLTDMSTLANLIATIDRSYAHLLQEGLMKAKVERREEQEPFAVTPDTPVKLH